MINNEETQLQRNTHILSKYKIVQKELHYQPMFMRTQERAIDETIATCSETDGNQKRKRFQ